ncbi:NADH-quinone oxidoreductase subunit L [Ferruginibacter lapsinanis]|uniref:NADH-quinone oxidoreductase subunit L n=1 Tax=Ferruginibacter lapsinanis TaxID=563172 RepID=UPI001E3D5F37|nr:NADH-quinone oxidoreductase subunit L [Ferruginibacter lapsinanis]UEG48839.1 NADH-quinone oxidoreductase subunit L [Ferruginibacter lapsinanis]
MPNSTYIALIPLLPLAGFIVLGLFGRKYFKQSAGIIATGLLLAATILSIYTAYGYFFDYGKINGVYEKLVPLKYTWLEFSPGVSIDMGILLDPISAMMLVVVTFISLMVHIYSLAYMKGEDRFPTYFSFLGLFTFSMLGLVIASNIFQIYIFWELVGVSSFLLIGYYYDRPSAVAACKKAFIVTRFADLGFLIGILILSFYSGTLDFNTLIQRLTSPESTQLKTAIASTFFGISALTWGMILVFIGGAGKSAMFPLHIWLPDAMEGPTPVSALIHAATMVVAGVFLVARLFPIFAISTPHALELVGYVGAVSALIAAIIACTQTDIKRVLAYSTMSQIGYMMFALGVSKYGGEDGLGYTASMFHLFTHAMFKALLFLGAGAVIHFIHSNEMKDMGGLRKFLPVTHITFLIACLAIAGVPPFAGFFSKEEILLAAYHHNTTIYWIALITSGLTAFYMFRLYFSIFWNKTHTQHGEKHGEGGFAMLLPLVLLAIGAAAAGFIPFGNFVSTDGKTLESKFHLEFSIAPVAIGLAGILIAMVLYKKQNNKPEKIAAALSGVYKAAYHKFYIDELYLFITKKILFNLIGRPAAWIDKNIVDGGVNKIANTTLTISEKIKGIQSGKVQQYAIYFLVATITIAAVFIYWLK